MAGRSPVGRVQSGGGSSFSSPLPVELALRMRFEPPHQFAGLRKLFVVELRNQSIRHTPTSGVKWQQLAIQLVRELRRVPDKPDSTLPIYLHDGCLLMRRGRHLAIGVKRQCPMAEPLPMTPTCHSPWISAKSGAPLPLTQLPPLQAWTAKKPLPVWRGSRTDCCGNTSTRSRSVLLSKTHPDLLDSRFVDPRMADAAPRIDFPRFFDYKVILDLAGAGGSFRLSSLLLGNSVVVSADPYRFWWFDRLPPNAIVDVRPDLSDLVDALRRINRTEKVYLEAVRRRRDAVSRGAMGEHVRNARWQSILARFPLQPAPLGGAYWASNAYDDETCEVDEAERCYCT